MESPFFSAASGEGSPHQLFIYDVIGDYFWEPGVTAKWIIAQLQQAEGGDVEVRINSNGGDHMEGTAIYNALANYEGKVTVRIEGYACSMATVIACAGDVVECYETALLMVHKASTSAWGNAAELREIVDMLEKADSSIVTAYHRKTGKSEDEITALLDEKCNTWLTAVEAKELGIVDQVVVPAKFNVLQDKAAAKALGEGEGAVLIKPEQVPKAVRSELAGVPGVMAYAVEPGQIRALRAQASSQPVAPAGDLPADEPEVDPVAAAVAKESARVSAILAMANSAGLSADDDFVRDLIKDQVPETMAGKQIQAVAKAVSQGTSFHQPPPSQGQNSDTGWGSAYKINGVKTK